MADFDFLTTFFLDGAARAAVGDSYDPGFDMDAFKPWCDVVITPLLIGQNSEEIRITQQDPKLLLLFIPIQARLETGVLKIVREPAAAHEIPTAGEYEEQEESIGVPLIAETPALELPDGVHLAYHVAFGEMKIRGGRFRYDNFTFMAPTTATRVDIATVERVDTAPSTRNDVVVRMIPDDWDIDEDGSLRLFANGIQLGPPRNVVAPAVAQQVAAQVPPAATAAANEVTPGIAENYWSAQTPGIVPGDTPGTVRQVFGGVESGEYPAGASLWPGVAGRPELPVDVSTEGGLDKTGSADIVAGLNSLITTHAGNRKLRFPKGDYKIGSTAILIKSGTHIEFDPDARFICDALPPSINYFQTDGHSESTPAAMTFDTNAGSATVTLPTGAGAGFSSGDIIGLRSQAVLFRNTDDTADVRPRELRKVISVSSDTVTLDAPLEHTYLVADTAEYFKETMVENVSLDGLRFYPGAGVTPGDTSARAIHLVKARNVSIRGLQFHDMVGGLLAYDCYDMHIDGVLGNELPKLGAFPGYVVALGGSCTNVIVDALQSRENRHAFTTLGTTIGGIFYDGPMFVQVNNAIVFGSENAVTAVLDTHPEGRHIAFNNPMVVGGLTGIQIRNKYAYINNPVCIRQKTAGITIAAAARYVWITNPVVKGSGTNGILLSGSDISIEHPDVTGCGWSASGGGISTNGSTRVTIFDPHLYGNATRGISDSTVTPSVGLRIIGGRIPYSAAQPISVYALPTDAKMTGTMCDGFGAGVTGLNSPQAGCVYSIQTDTKIVSNTADITGSQSLNFGTTPIPAQTSRSLTLAAMGATPGDPVALGIPLAAVTAGIAYTARVSGTNQITVTAHNYTAGALSPAAGTFRVRVMPI